jgi:hypothetical protein
MTRKLSEHVEEELFNKEKRVKLQEGVEPTPVKKKKPYYRKKYNKPEPVEVVTPKLYKNIKVEPFKFLPEPKKYTFLKWILIGVGIELVVGLIIKSIL